MTNIDDYVFVVTCHISAPDHHQYWQRCYQSIRQFYQNNLIVIINDNSKLPMKLPELVANDKLCVIYNTNDASSQLTERGAGEILPYVYHWRHRWKPYMICIHDSMTLQRQFTDTELTPKCGFVPHWTFSNKTHNNSKKINKFLSYLNCQYSVLEYTGLYCFSGMSIIHLSVIDQLQSTYAIWTALPKYIKSRDDRMAFERILGIIIYLSIDREFAANFGDIVTYPDAFKTKKPLHTSTSVLDNYSGAILKTWIGR